MLGFSSPAIGRIDTVTRGITVSDAAPSTQGLPNVNAVYTWVRLAQRVLVRIRITHVPPGVPLISGLTATIIDRSNKSGADATLRAWAASRVEEVSHAFRALSRGPNCIPPTMGGRSIWPAAIPDPEAPAEVDPDQIIPGLALVLNARPSLP